MNSTRRLRPHQRGYVLMVVMILLVVLTAAGIYGLRSVQGDFKASAMAKRNEIALFAAEAGASVRIAELMLATEDAGAALASAVEGVAQPYPAAPLGNEPISTFEVVADPIVAVSANPPPGVQVGSGGQVTMWRVDSFAITRMGPATGNSQRVSVGLSMWSRGGLSYNIN